MTNSQDVVVITGASGGIGRALALRLAADNKRIVLAARRGGELHKVAEEATSRGATDVLEVPTDVTKRDSVTRQSRNSAQSMSGSTTPAEASLKRPWTSPTPTLTK